jgi:hypothetical protein
MGGEVVEVGAKEAAERAAENHGQHIHLPRLDKIPGRRVPPRDVAFYLSNFDNS